MPGKDEVMDERTVQQPPMGAKGKSEASLKAYRMPRQ